MLKVSVSSANDNNLVVELHKGKRLEIRRSFLNTNPHNVSRVITDYLALESARA